MTATAGHGYAAIVLVIACVRIMIISARVCPCWSINAGLCGHGWMMTVIKYGWINVMCNAVNKMDTMVKYIYN